jgi:deoxyribonuclease V
VSVCSNEPDIARLVYEATAQIPEGKVSTYGDIANALGDPVAARAVGEVLSHNPTPIVVPCHRVVYATGRTGWYGGHGQGADRKVGLLRAEGVRVEDGAVVDLDAVRFTHFRIEPVLRELREEQDRIRELVVEEDRFGALRRVAGLDVSYADGRAFGALAVYDLASGEPIEERTAESVVRFPYIPTYLSYREIPALRPLIDRSDDLVYLIDGQGVLHPRGAGVASHIGVCFDVPTIGAAKSLLVGQVQDAGADPSPILLGGRVRGCRLGSGKRATYVSVGHRVSLETSVTICGRFLQKGIPLPLRRAHDLATAFRRSSE